MYASTGDTLLVHGRTVEMAEREGEIVEVRGEHGSPPYLVRFDDGRERLVFPGTDSEVRHNER